MRKIIFLIKVTFEYNCLILNIFLFFIQILAKLSLIFCFCLILLDHRIQNHELEKEIQEKERLHVETLTFLTNEIEQLKYLQK